jgi:hypothetical protein
MVRITYQLRSEKTPRSLELTPAEYYDPLGPGETYERGAIPRFHHAYQYTEHSTDDLKWTVLEGGPIKGSVIRTQFLDGRRSMMTHRADADGSEEIIHTTAIGYEGLLIVRTAKWPGQSWAVTNSGYSENDANWEEQQVGWSFEEMQVFGRVGVQAEAPSAPSDLIQP